MNLPSSESGDVVMVCHRGDRHSFIARWARPGRPGTRSGLRALALRLSFSRGDLDGEPATASAPTPAPASKTDRSRGRESRETNTAKMRSRAAML